VPPAPFAAAAVATVALAAAVCLGAAPTTTPVLGPKGEDRPQQIEGGRYLADAGKTLAPAPQGVSSYVADPATARALRAGVNDGRGAELYVDNCAACHRSDGAGYERVFPSIAGNARVLASDPSSVIRLILLGGRLPATSAAPSGLAMPGFAWRLSDREVALLGTFIRNSWGNHAPAIGIQDVSRIRRDIERTAAHF